MGSGLGICHQAEGSCGARAGGFSPRADVPVKTLGGLAAILILLAGSRGRTGTTVDLPPICPGSSRKEKTACGSG